MVAISGAMACLAVVSYAGLVGATPVSTITALLAMWRDGLLLAVLLGPGLLLLWSLDLLVGRTRLPVRSIVLTWVVAACSVMWIVIGWPDGVEYQGTPFLVSLAVVNLAIFVSLQLWAMRLHEAPDWWSALAYHFILFVWLLSFGFPWLGETT